MNTTATRLRARRESLGLTQAELAERLTAIGVKYSQARISRLERGWSAPSADVIVGLARVLNVSVDELESPTDRPAQRTDILVLDEWEVAWLIDRLPPSRRADMLSRLKSTAYTQIAVVYAA